MKERLQKVMARAGVASRRQCETIISQGRVTVNGAIVKVLGTSVEPGKDFIKVDGSRLKIPAAASHFWVMNKPRYVVTTMSDPEGRDTIAQHLPKPLTQTHVFPVGRLDYDVSGCLLLTDDGTLANRLMHPKYEVQRVYRVKVLGVPNAKEIGRLCRSTDRAAVRYLRKSGDTSWWLLTLHEGRYHQVKKMWQQIGHPVEKMTRVSYGGIKIQGMAIGASRKLLAKEVAKLRSLCGLGERSKSKGAKPKHAKLKPRRSS